MRWGRSNASWAWALRATPDHACPRSDSIGRSASGSASVQVGGGAPGRRPVDDEHRHGRRRRPRRASASSWPRPGSELVRVTVNMPEAAAAVPEIKRAHARRGLHGAAHRRLPLQRPPAADALPGLRARRSTSTAINPGNVGTGKRRDEQFATICKVAVDHGKPVRIGVNGGSLNQELVMRRRCRRTPTAISGRTLRGDPQRVHGDLGARIDRARARGRPRARTRSSSRARCRGPRDLIAVYRELAQPDATSPCTSG